MLDTIRQDLVVAGRHLRRGRLVTAVALVSLALGIAANTTVFSLVKALTFPHLIYPDASRASARSSLPRRRPICWLALSHSSSPFR